MLSHQTLYTSHARENYTKSKLECIISNYTQNKRVKSKVETHIKFQKQSRSNQDAEQAKHTPSHHRTKNKNKIDLILKDTTSHSQKETDHKLKAEQTTQNQITEEEKHR